MISLDQSKHQDKHIWHEVINTDKKKEKAGIMIGMIKSNLTRDENDEERLDKLEIREKSMVSH
jgi:hypothetical protein